MEHKLDRRKSLTFSKNTSRIFPNVKTSRKQQKMVAKNYIKSDTRPPGFGISPYHLQCVPKPHLSDMIKSLSEPLGNAHFLHTGLKRT